MDADVLAEATRAAERGDGVRVHHLRKVYPTGQVARARALAGGHYSLLSRGQVHKKAAMAVSGCTNHLPFKCEVCSSRSQ